MLKQWILAGIAVSVSGVAAAVPIMHVHDNTGRLATVDVATGDVTVIGDMGPLSMTDIAFDPSGALFGINPTALYSIDAATASVTLIGNHSINGATALVFGSDGTLYGAGANTFDLFRIDPLTGASTSLGNMNFRSAGDLAFHNGNLYLASTTGQLVNVNLSDPGSSFAVGAFNVPNVFGLASADNGLLYAVAGTAVYTVDVLTGAATNPVNYAGQGLGLGWGQSFFTEAGAVPTASVPEPATLALLGAGLFGLGFLRLRRRPSRDFRRNSRSRADSSRLHCFGTWHAESGREDLRSRHLQSATRTMK